MGFKKRSYFGLLAFMAAIIGGFKDGGRVSIPVIFEFTGSRALCIRQQSMSPISMVTTIEKPEVGVGFL